MLRRVVRQQASGLLFLLLLLPALSAQTPIWPDQFGRFSKTGSRPVELADTAVWDEYGLQQAEQARYEAGGERFQALAWRLKDPTRALAAFQWLRRAEDQPSQRGPLAAESRDGLLLAHGNYLFRFQGYQPPPAELEPLFNRVPRLDQSPLPTLPGYLPTRNLVPESQRFVVGPESLAKFASRIPPSLAAFHLDAEAQLATYRTAKGEMNLAIFSYPTPQIAREQAAAFQKLPGAVAKRSGPLVAVVLSPPDADEAERLLASIQYQAEVSLSQYVPTARDNIGTLLLHIFILVGILVIFATVAGLAVGGLRRVASGSKAADPMILLHLADRGKTGD